MLNRFRALDPQLKLFLVSIGLLAMAGGIFETSFNNFLSDKFKMTADTRGFLEFPRELPGFLTALFAGLLFFAPETWIGGLSALAIGFGMFGLAFMGERWTPMLFSMMLWSIGSHLIMPIRSSVGMNLARAGQKGRRLGQIQGVGIASSIVGCLVVWFFMKYAKSDYAVIFTVGGCVAVIAAVFFFLMRMPGAHLDRPKFVWNGKYRLYYTLQLLFGARKQIFITFGPWVLVKVFHQPVWIFAQLWIAASVLGLFFQPALGRAIDRYGERAVLMLDGVLTFAVCMGYAFADKIPVPGLALGLLYACLIGDQLLFGTGMARDTYLSKIAVKKEDIAPTLSLGVSINHVVSMSIPSLGGLLWINYGHPAVFYSAAGIALLMVAFTSRIRLP
jgi:hypothetical protein